MQLKCHFSLLFFLGLSAVNSPATAAMDVPAGASISLPSGSVIDLACGDLTVSGSLVVGTATIGSVQNVAITTGGMLDAGSGTVNLAGDWSNSGQFLAGSSTVAITDACSLTSSQFFGNTTFNNLTIRSASGRVVNLAGGSVITVLGALEIVGASGQPVRVTSSSGGRIALGPNATVVEQFAEIDVPLTRLPAAVASIPTLGTYGMLLLVALMAVTFAFMRKHFFTNGRI